MTTTDQTPARGDGGSVATGNRHENGALSRRAALRALGSATVGGAALGTVSGATRAQSGGAALESWFEGVSNYDGVVDETGADSITVEVGVEANGGPFGFGPAAVRVDPGTTVTWTWTGQGGSHNVAADDYESDLVDSGGHTFEHTFKEEGVSTYACTPHETLGMKGAVVVGDVEVNEGETSGSTESGSGGGTSTESGGDAGGSGDGEPEEETLGPADAEIAAPFGDTGARRFGGFALGGVFGLALASPGLFGAFLWLTGGGDERPDGE